MPKQEKNIRVLIVCDQSDTAPLLGYMIRENGLSAVVETSVQRALNRAVDLVPELVVIDVNAPHRERMQLVQEYRKLTENPILLFLPNHHETEILESYQAGVDECVVKPISPAIFIAKIAAWAKRSRTPLLQPATSQKLTLDPARRSAKISPNEEIALTHLEFRLIRLLTSRPGYVFTNDEIIRAVWGSSGEKDLAALKNVIYRLRKKLGKKREYMIQTSPGGYSFRED
jgi:DNA-binding response OmpR family regulator